MVKYGIYNKNSGFSIVEMIIALTIIILVAASLVPLMVYVTTSGQSNQAKIAAGNLSLSVMEKIRAMDYESIGTVNGNPSGSIPQLQEGIEMNGMKFDVETLISWGSAKENNVIINPVAYKNIRIIARGINPFTNKKENLSELHSIVTRDGEEPIIENGHIRAIILDSQDQPLGEPSVHVEITSPVNQSLLTDYNGTALFGILEAGSYNLRAKVEDELMPSPKETVTNGWIERKNIEVEDYTVTNVTFQMEKKTNACHLIIKLIDKYENTVIAGNGKATLTLFLEGQTYTVYNEKEFTADDFEEECLPASFSGDLWPKGAYNIRITGVSGYKDYDLSVNRDAFLTDKNDLWNGEFEETGTALTVTIPMEPAYYYEEKTKEDFEKNTEMENLIATDHDTLELDYYSMVLDPDLIINLQSSSHSGSSTPYNLFDGDKKQNSRWDSGVSPDKQPQWVRCEFDTPVMLTAIRFYLSHNQNNPDTTPNHKPKDFEIRVSIDGSNWETVYKGQFPDDQYSYLVLIDPPAECKYFELYITSEHGNKSQGIRLYEIEFIQKTGQRREHGERLSLPISLAEHKTDKYLYIEWDANVPEGTSFEIWTAVTEGKNKIPVAGFKKAGNGDIIPDIGYLGNFENKYLWIKEVFTAEDQSLSPVLNWLRIIEKGPVD